MPDEVRKEFIKAFELEKGYKPAGAEFGDGFSAPYEDGAWWAWKASRKAIEIELPKASSERNNEVVKAVGRHIIGQGLKVKPC